MEFSEEDKMKIRNSTPEDKRIYKIFERPTYSDGTSGRWNRRPTTNPYIVEPKGININNIYVQLK